MYKFEENRLLYDGKPIFEAPSVIRACLKNSFNESAVIVYDGYEFMEDPGLPVVLYPKVDPALQEKINQNVLCIARDGKILWRIESTFDYPVPFNQLFEKNGELWAYRIDRREFCIDRENGKILKHELGL